MVLRNTTSFFSFSALKRLKAVCDAGFISVLDFQGPILQNSISGENFADKFSSLNLGPISIQKRQIYIYLGKMDNAPGFKGM
jgi:hypothetical protein